MCISSSRYVTPPILTFIRIVEPAVGNNSASRQLFIEIADMKNVVNSILPQVAVPLWGLLGGLALVFIAGLEQNANTVVPIFGIILFSFALVVKLKAPENRVGELFKTTWLVYTAMFLIDYVYIITVISPFMLTVPLLGHAWRILLAWAIGGFVSFPLAYFATRIRKRLVIESL